MRPITISQSITDRQDESLGLYFKDVSKQSMIDINEEIALTKRIKKGDREALDKLVRANLRFAISIAKQYQNNGLPLVDLIQEANLGLIKAAETYDETKGFRFISYAVWWIRQAIMRALSDQCRTVRIPANQIVSYSKVTKAISKFEQEHNRKPDTTELESETNLSESKINTALTAISRSVSLESPLKVDETSGTLLDTIVNDSCEDINDSINNKETSDIINKILDTLSYRERDIIRMSFGINMIPMQNEEIAWRFGIGAERVRQIQHEALEKIRINYSNELKELL